MVSSTSLLQEITPKLTKYQKVVFITDENLERIYRPLICGFPSIVVPAGEETKSRTWKAFIEDRLMEMDVQREDLLIAFGGGVITDLVGFVAATYKRGIDYISIPTSLMAMVDAAIGGKTGINTAFGKNTLGAFYPPVESIFQSAFLKTLPDVEFRAGMQEVIKYALIWDRELWHLIERGSYSMDRVIQRCRQIKEEIVQKDPLDRGIRRILNFGHTVGHALEKLSQYSISHGQAVWFGILLESRLSEKLGYLSKKELNVIENLMVREDLKFEIGDQFSGNALYDAMRNDKKSSPFSVRIVLLKQIGEVEAFSGQFCTELERDAFLSIY